LILSDKDLENKYKKKKREAFKAKKRLAKAEKKIRKQEEVIKFCKARLDIVQQDLGQMALALGLPFENKLAEGSA
jgi:hypothetical protein